MKLSDEERQSILNACRDDSDKLIEYFEEQNQEQQKRDNLNLFFTILNTLIAIGAFITSIIAIVN